MNLIFYGITSFILIIYFYILGYKSSLKEGSFLKIMKEGMVFYSKKILFYLLPKGRISRRELWLGRNLILREI